MNNSSSVLRLPSNTVGKDYVVGDLHGCYNLLERLLEQVRFDTSRDRLFSVGDLIDRGPDSLRCLQLLAEPWFYAAQGNHEKMMLNFFLPYLVSGKLKSLGEIYESDFLANGGSWIKQYYQFDHQRMSEEFDRCLSLLLDMPLIWVVGEGRSRFHVIHGELARPYHRSSGQIVWLDSDIDRWADGEEMHPNTRERLYWGRTLMQGEVGTRDSALVHKGLSTTFCGHTYLRNPRQILSHLCLDTGAFLSMNTTSADAGDYGLTLFDVKEENWLRASYGRSGMITSANIHR